jgi:hypothetical protein
MPYYKNPINYPKGLVCDDTRKINENFAQLALAFLNNDPTTGIVKKANNADNADTVDGFHASQTPAPNTIPVANSTGKIPLDWLDFEGKIKDNWLSDIIYGEALMSSDQYIPPGVWTKIAFNKSFSEFFSPPSSEFIVPVGGIYVVMASVNFYLYGSGTYTRKALRICINNIRISNEADNDGRAGDGANVWTQGIFSLNAYDAVSIYGYFGIVGGPILAQHSWFIVFRLR